MNAKLDFVEFMVRSGVLTFGDFTAKSGRKTPYFVNTGRYRTGAQLAQLGEHYARCIVDNGLGGADMLFGPAYKGIPLSVACASALYLNHGIDMGYAFNRKEAKDHGEGGVIVGMKPSDGDHVIIIEDVITAGTSVRETVPLLKAAARVHIDALIISVDRMERGQGAKSAVQEVEEAFGIPTYSLVTTREIIDMLYNRPVDGKVYIDAEMRERMEAYLERYGVEQSAKI